MVKATNKEKQLVHQFVEVLRQIKGMSKKSIDLEKLAKGWEIEYGINKVCPYCKNKII